MAFISLDTEITYKTLNCCILLQESLLIWFRNGKWYLRDRWIIQHALKQSVKFEFGDNLNIWAALITKKYLKQLNLNGSFRIKGFTSGNVFALVFFEHFYNPSFESLKWRFVRTYRWVNISWLYTFYSNIGSMLPSEAVYVCLLIQLVKSPCGNLNGRI